MDRDNYTYSEEGFKTLGIEAYDIGALQEQVAIEGADYTYERFLSEQYGYDDPADELIFTGFDVDEIKQNYAQFYATRVEKLQDQVFVDVTESRNTNLNTAVDEANQYLEFAELSVKTGFYEGYSVVGGIKDLEPTGEEPYNYYEHDDINNTLEVAREIDKDIANLLLEKVQDDISDGRFIEENKMLGTLTRTQEDRPIEEVMDKVNQLVDLRSKVLYGEINLDKYTIEVLKSDDSKREFGEDRFTDEGIREAVGKGDFQQLKEALQDLTILEGVRIETSADLPNAFDQILKQSTKDHLLLSDKDVKSIEDSVERFSDLHDKGVSHADIAHVIIYGLHNEVKKDFQSREKSVSINKEKAEPAKVEKVKEKEQEL